MGKGARDSEAVGSLFGVQRERDERGVVFQGEELEGYGMSALEGVDVLVGLVYM